VARSVERASEIDDAAAGAEAEALEAAEEQATAATDVGTDPVPSTETDAAADAESPIEES
jgi:hypothetical protein